MDRDNARVFVLSTVVAIGLSIWGVLVAKNSLVSVLLCVQLVILAGLGILAGYLARRVKRDRSQLGVVRLLRERRDGRDLEYTFIANSRKEIILVGIVHRTFWSDKARFEEALETAAGHG